MDKIKVFVPTTNDDRMVKIMKKMEYLGNYTPIVADEKSIFNVGNLTLEEKAQRIKLLCDCDGIVAMLDYIGLFYTKEELKIADYLSLRYIYVEELDGLIADKVIKKETESDREENNITPSVDSLWDELFGGDQ